jgi:hypothetical protein
MSANLPKALSASPRSKDGRMKLFLGLSLPVGTRGLTAALAVLITLTAVGRAEAGVLVESAKNCQQPPLERPFLPWADPAHYVLTPDGSFSRQAKGWDLSDAAVIAQNEPWNVRDEARAASLRVSAGGSATSPVMCVGMEHPTLRLFARNTGSMLAPLDIDVLYEDAEGHARSLRMASLVGHSGWAPTLPLPIVVNLLPLLPGEQTPVAFRFTSRGSGSAWLIDDVYVDPYRKG